MTPSQVIEGLHNMVEHLKACGDPYAGQANLIREALNLIENAHDTNPPPNRSSPPVGACVIDGDDIPGVRCSGFGCES